MFEIVTRQACPRVGYTVWEGEPEAHGRLLAEGQASLPPTLLVLARALRNHNLPDGELLRKALHDESTDIQCRTHESFAPRHREVTAHDRIPVEDTFLGRLLFRALPAAIRIALVALFRSGEPGRVIHLVAPRAEAHDILSLPWEALVIVPQDVGRIPWSVHFPIVRRVAPAREPAGHLPRGDRLRVLFVVGDLEKSGTIPVPSEMVSMAHEGVDRALRGLAQERWVRSAQRMRPRDRTELALALADSGAHVLICFGHGVGAEAASEAFGATSLCLPDEDVPFSEIGSLLPATCRTVILLCCDARDAAARGLLAEGPTLDYVLTTAATVEAFDAATLCSPLLRFAGGGTMIPKVVALSRPLVAQRDGPARAWWVPQCWSALRTHRGLVARGPG